MGRCPKGPPSLKALVGKLTAAITQRVETFLPQLRAAGLTWSSLAAGILTRTRGQRLRHRWPSRSVYSRHGRRPPMARQRAAATPVIRRRRSVDQLGRYSETTLFITGFQFEISAFASPGADQLDRPAGSANTGNLHWRGGQHRHPPVRGGGGLPEIGHVGLAANAVARDRWFRSPPRRA